MQRRKGLQLVVSGQARPMLLNRNADFPRSQERKSSPCAGESCPAEGAMTWGTWGRSPAPEQMAIQGNHSSTPAAEELETTQLSIYLTFTCCRRHGGNLLFLLAPLSVEETQWEFLHDHWISSRFTPLM